MLINWDQINKLTSKRESSFMWSPLTAYKHSVNIWPNILQVISFPFNIFGFKFSSEKISETNLPTKLLNFSSFFFSVM